MSRQTALRLGVIALSFAFGCQKTRPRRTPRVRSAPAPVAGELDDDPPPPSASPPSPSSPPPPPPVPVAPVARLRDRRDVPRPEPGARAAPPLEYRAVKDDPSPCADTKGKGERLSVRGVDPSDVLNLRAQPDTQSPILIKLPPDTTGLRGTANRHAVGHSIWREIECGALRGWVNQRFLAPVN